MSYLDSMVGSTIQLEVSGKIERVGVMVDCGADIIVIYDGFDYVYFPTSHIQHIRLITNVSQISEPGYDRTELKNNLTYKGILNESKGMFLKIFVTGNQALHGYITSIQNDYFVFYSPVHKTLLIPLFHLKWLIPYPENQTPYTLSEETFPLTLSTQKMAKTLDEQLKKMEDKLVVFDLGSNPDKIGLLKHVQNNMAKLVNADQKTIYWNIHHIKIVSFPEL